MGMAKQFLFPGFEKLKEKDFGGSLLKGNAREARPVSIKRPMHLVMRSELAKGEHSFLCNTQRKNRIKALIDRAALAHGVKVYRYANGGNHLHLIVLPRSRVAFQRFIRTISGLIARLTLKVERGTALQSSACASIKANAGIKRKFWDARPFTRLLEWGRDYRQACAYVVQNTMEALGFFPYRPRGRDPRLRGKINSRKKLSNEFQSMGMELT